MELPILSDVTSRSLAQNSAIDSSEYLLHLGNEASVGRRGFRIKMEGELTSLRMTNRGSWVAKPSMIRSASKP